MRRRSKKNWYAYKSLGDNGKEYFGVTNNWEECQRNVEGRRSLHKGFWRKKEAERWLRSAQLSLPISREANDETSIMEEYVVICPYCGGRAELANSSVIYGTDYGYVYLCRCVPDWAYVGCIKGTTRPLGHLADKELREARKRAHEVFDAQWKEGSMSRSEAYRWLAEAINVPDEECHIAKFGLEHCRRTIDMCSDWVRVVVDEDTEDRDEESGIIPF